MKEHAALAYIEKITCGRSVIKTEIYRQRYGNPRLSAPFNLIREKYIINPENNLLRGKRLRHKPFCAEVFQSFNHLRGLVNACYSQYVELTSKTIRPYPFQYLKAIHAGHLEVKQYHIHSIRVYLYFFYELCAVFYNPHLMPSLSEDIAELYPEKFAVICHHYTFRLSGNHRYASIYLKKGERSTGKCAESLSIHPW